MGDSPCPSCWDDWTMASMIGDNIHPAAQEEEHFMPNSRKLFHLSVMSQQPQGHITGDDHHVGCESLVAMLQALWRLSATPPGLDYSVPPSPVGHLWSISDDWHQAGVWGLVMPLSGGLAAQQGQASCYRTLCVTRGQQSFYPPKTWPQVSKHSLPLPSISVLTNSQRLYFIKIKSFWKSKGAVRSKRQASGWKNTF